MNESAQQCICRVYFPDKNASYSYYNDLFHLHLGDIVFVEGKLEGERGCVVEINRNFKIKLSDYKRVIGRADTTVAGTFRLAGDYLIAQDRETLPYEKVITWFKAPEKPEDDYIAGSDDTAFPLEHLEKAGFDSGTAERGENYFRENRVLYLELDGEVGRAIVRGTRCYEVAFTFDGESVRALTCDCYLTMHCKHEFAVMRTLSKILKAIAQKPEYFAAVEKELLIAYTLNLSHEGEITLNVGNKQN